MQNVSKAYKKSMSEYIRNRGYIKVYIGIINSVAQENVNADDSRNLFSHLSEKSNAFNGETVSQVYATGEEDFSKVDNTMYFAPLAETEDMYNQGIITEELLGSVYIGFRGITGLDIKGLTIDFGEYYPTEFEVATDNGTVTYTNDSAKFVTEDVFEGISYFIITPTTMVNGQGRLRIEQFSCGIINVFTNKETVKFTSKEHISPISDSVPSMDMTLTVDNYKLYYNPDNPNSAIAFMEQGQEVKTIFGYELPDNSVEWLPPIRTYLKSWSANDSQAKFTSTDLFDYYKSKYYRGVLGKTNLYDLAIDVLTDMGIEDYFVDPYLRNVPIVNPMPAVKHTEALQIIANAGRCVLSEDREGHVKIKSSFVPDSWASTNDETEFSRIANVLDREDKLEYAITSNDFSVVDSTLFFMPKNGDYLPTGYISNAVYNGEEWNGYGKNLIPFPYEESSKTVYGITFTVNSDGSVMANGTASNVSNNSFALVHLKANTRYALMGGYSADLRIDLRNATDRVIYTANVEGKEVISAPKISTFTNINDIDVYVNARVAQGKTINNITLYPMLVEVNPVPQITIDLETAYDTYGLGISFRSTYPALFEVITYNNDVLVDDVFFEPDSVEFVTQEHFKTWDKMEIIFTEGYENARIVIDNIRLGDVTDYLLTDAVDLYESPTSERQNKVKDINVVKTTYTDSIEEEAKDIKSETIDISSKNLMQFNNPSSRVFPYTSKGVTWVRNEDDTFTANGTREENAGGIEFATLTLPSGSYILNGCPKGGGEYTYEIRAIIGDDTYRDYGYGIQFELEEESTVNVSLIIRPNYECEDLTFLPMIRDASTNEDDYVQYGYYIKSIQLSKASYDFNAEIVLGEEETSDITVSVIDYSAFQVTLKFGNVSTTTETVKYKVTGFEYQVSESNYSVHHNEFGDVIDWKNPLISSDTLANDVAEWLASYYMGDVDYKIKWRGDPRTDANDLFYLKLKDRDKVTIRTYQNELSFDGSWKGNMKSRKVVL